MTHHLIIIGEQGVGKTLLGNWIIENSDESIKVVDGCSREQILKKSFEIEAIKREPYRRKPMFVFITNDMITYKDVPENNFLIIKLQSLQ